jgi:septum formation protein
LILASASPQRRAILASLGVQFEVRPSDVLELDEGPAAVVARENALRKAAAVHGDPSRPPGVVLGVDTVVSLGLELWGKPVNAESAAETLRHLAGETHQVVSGFAVIAADGTVTAGDDTTDVTFRELDDDTIARYVACGEWEGRAGGYAIQGRGGALVRRIEGDYLNVVGLPLARLLDLVPELLPAG